VDLPGELGVRPQRGSDSMKSWSAFACRKTV